MATIRVKILRDYKDFRKGQTLYLSPNEAFGLIDSGRAEVTKDMTEFDYHVKKPFKPRTARQHLDEDMD